MACRLGGHTQWQRHSLRVAASARAHMCTCIHTHTLLDTQQISNMVKGTRPRVPDLGLHPFQPWATERARERPAALAGWRHSYDGSTQFLPTCHMVSLQLENGPMATCLLPHLGTQMDKRKRLVQAVGMGHLAQGGSGKRSLSPTGRKCWVKAHSRASACWPGLHASSCRKGGGRGNGSLKGMLVTGN